MTTLGATWVDFDGDGDVDLYLSNYGRADLDNPEFTGEPNQMFQNENGVFTDVTAQSNLGNPGHSSVLYGLIMIMMVTWTATR